jgi:hypothetical protein
VNEDGTANGNFKFKSFLYSNLSFSFISVTNLAQSINQDSQPSFAGVSQARIKYFSGFG